MSQKTTARRWERELLQEGILLVVQPLQGLMLDMERQVQEQAQGLSQKRDPQMEMLFVALQNAVEAIRDAAEKEADLRWPPIEEASPEQKEPKLSAMGSFAPGSAPDGR